MKKTLAAFLLLFACLFSACGSPSVSNTPEPEPEASPVPLIPISIYYDAALSEYDYSSVPLVDTSDVNANSDDLWLWVICIAVDDYYRAYERYVGNPSLAVEESSEFLALAQKLDEDFLKTAHVDFVRAEYNNSYCDAVQNYFDAVQSWATALVLYVQFGPKAGYTESAVLDAEALVLNCELAACIERVKFQAACGLLDNEASTGNISSYATSAETISKTSTLLQSTYLADYMDMPAQAHQQL